MGKISQKTYLDMYYFMKLGRALEERLEMLYRTGQIPSAIYLGRGQEASTVGVASALKSEDVLATTHRDIIAQLPKGMDVKLIMAQHFGKATSPTKGKGEDNYLGDLNKGILTSVSMLPDFYPVATGAALAFKYKGEKRVALAFSGEGATSRGDFHEALNMAAVMELPVVFVVINNQFAYSTPFYKETKVKNVADKAAAYAMPGVVVDGNDVLAVYKVAKKAIEAARAGKGPTLIECKTMRMRGHAGHDPAKYVPKELLAEWEKRDPIKLYEKVLLEQNILNEAKITEIDQKVQTEIEEAVKFSQESPWPDPQDVIKDVYA